MMYRTARNNRRVRADRKISYNATEMQRAAFSLTEAVNRGALSWLKVKFEHNPMEAVPNVWEGDEGMMKHVPRFPMPPCVTLPLEQGGGRAAGSFPSNDMSGYEAEDSDTLHDADLEIAKASTEACKDFGVELKRRGMEKKFWVRMAKLVMSLETLNQSTMRLRNKFTNESDRIKKHDCQHFANLYKEMQKIKGKLHKADLDYKRNAFTDLFQMMPPSQKIVFKRNHQIQGKLPNSLGCIVKKYNFIRSKLREIVHKNYLQLEEYKDILAIIVKDAFLKSDKDSLALKIFKENEEKKNEAFCVDEVDELGMAGDMDEGLDGEGKAKKRKLENTDGTEASDAMMSREDLFWENLINLKKMMHKASMNLSRLESADTPDASHVFRKNGMLMCRQLLNVHKSIISFISTLARLKEEMQAHNYEEKKPFTEEDLTSKGIEGLTPDNSLVVVEALLNKLKDKYLKVQDEKQFVLEMFGYCKDLPLEKKQNVQLVRICDHSKTAVSIHDISRLARWGDKPKPNKKGKSEKFPDDLHKQNEMGEVTNQVTTSLNAGTGAQQDPLVKEEIENVTLEDEADRKDANADVTTSEDIPVCRNTADGDGIPTDVAAAGGEDDDSDESALEDPSDNSKNVNSLSFFMSNLGPDALTVNEQSSSEPVASDFIEKEKQYWNRLQKLLRRIDKNINQVLAKESNTSLQGRQLRGVVKGVQYRVKQLSDNFQLEKAEANRAGYCKHVVYEDLQYLSEGAAEIVVTSLGQIQQRINMLRGYYKDLANRLGVPPYMFKL